MNDKQRLLIDCISLLPVIGILVLITVANDQFVTMVAAYVLCGELSCVLVSRILNLYYIDMRLSQKDEAEVGNYPALSDDKRTFHYAVPEWAHIANNPNAYIPKDENGKPTREPYDGSLIVFEELNRANQYVRNAGLQLLQERKIGELFKFNDDVYMAATGNLGEEDGTTVEEFDAALVNRLVTLKHYLKLDEWIKEYAEDNVHSIIISYLKSNAAEFFKKAKDEGMPFATARSWSHLSEYIIKNYGVDAKIKDFANDLKQIGIGYVGSSINKFLRYLEEIENVSINDILTRFEQVESTVKEFNRSRISDLLTQLKAKDGNKFKKDQVTNIIKFFKYIPDDEKIAYILFVFKEYMTSDNTKNAKKQIYKLVEGYKDIVTKVKSYNVDK